MLLAILAVVSVSAKFVVQTVSFDGSEQWQYFAKFAVDVGTGQFKVRARLISPVDEKSDDEHPFLLPIYLDSQWEEALAQQTCEGRLRSARLEKLLTVPRNGEWSDEVGGNLMQRVRPYFWFFALSSCGSSEPMRLKVEAVFFNVDESHYSLEDKNLEYLYLGALLIFLGALSASSLALFHRFQKLCTMERPLLLLNSSILAQVCAIVCALLHYWQYASNGRGITFLDFLSQGLDLLSQLLITVILLLVSTGWTITYRDLPGIETALPASFFLILLEFLAAGMNRFGDEAYDKFSEFDGVPGLFIITIRLCLLGAFIVSAKSLHKRTQGVVQTVIMQFALIASLYFFAVPCISLCSRFFAAYLRNKVVLVANFSVQLVAFISLSTLFREKSQYHKVSTFAESVLPGKLR